MAEDAVVPYAAGDGARRGAAGDDGGHEVVMGLDAMPPGRCRTFWWFAGFGPGHVQINYPNAFKVLACLAMLLSVLWMFNYITLVSPAMNLTSPQACSFADEQLRHSTKLLILYFTLVVVVRIGIFIPGVATRYVLFCPEQHGPCYYYTAHMMLHGPLYAFSCSVLLFWVQLMQSPICMERNAKFYSALQWNAGESVIVSVLHVALAVWHFRILASASRTFKEFRRKAPPGTIERLATIPYDESLFGDEDGKRYPAECAICLDDWNAENTIKATPCGHVFHEECLRDWLDNSRICALCRHDVTRPWVPPQARPPRPKENEGGEAEAAAVPETPSTVDEPAAVVIGATVLSLPAAVQGSSARSTGSSNGSDFDSPTASPAAEDARPVSSQPAWSPPLSQRSSLSSHTARDVNSFKVDVVSPSASASVATIPKSEPLQRDEDTA
eukprot:TRINITY_DN30519_c0_g1_i1.p1 TRINITY_DN30519_c0_g1~~TRINITY_DN30519_c0_g1_i1.p1  ORF type:complete len:442 (+),score=69.31 TRINITY_DN30519_c0_g1_i1:157-1482(+)